MGVRRMLADAAAVCAVATLVGVSAGVPSAGADDPVAVTVTASDATMAYGAGAPPVSASYAGFPAGLDESDLAVPPTCAADLAAGTTNCSGAADPRFTFSYVPGTLTVTPAPLRITASDVTWVNDDTSEQPVPLYDGLVAGDDEPATPPTCSVDEAAFTTSCTGAADTHYTISYEKGTFGRAALNEAPTVGSVDDAPGSVAHARTHVAAPSVLPNTGNPANPLLAALGALLVGVGVGLVRRASRAA